MPFYIQALVVTDSVQLGDFTMGWQFSASPLVANDLFANRQSLTMHAAGQTYTTISGSTQVASVGEVLLKLVLPCAVDVLVMRGYVWVPWTVLAEIGEPNPFSQSTATTVWYHFNVLAGPPVVKFVVQIYPQDPQALGTWSNLTPSIGAMVFLDPVATARVDTLDEVQLNDYICPSSWPSQSSGTCFTWIVAAGGSYALQVSMDPWPGFGLMYGVVTV